MSVFSQPAFIKNGAGKAMYAVLAVIAGLSLFFVFYEWKTESIYYDDLFLFEKHIAAKNFFQQINILVESDKYRPVHGVVWNLLIDLFEKKIWYIFYFNLLVQIINLLMFAAVIDLFLNAPFISLLVGLTLGQSRFCIFNITQLYNGGALEGLAMFFFLGSLFYLLKGFIRNTEDRQIRRDVLIAILFANLSTYTHERYILLLPFILLIMFFHRKTMTAMTKIIAGSLAVASVVLNIGIKKFFFGMPFFVGTGGTNISLSADSVRIFFRQALLSILQINSGEQWFIGRAYETLPGYAKVISLSLAVFSVLVLLMYAGRSIIQAIHRRNSGSVIDHSEGPGSGYKKTDHLPGFFGVLCVLFFLLLIPAIITIRLEPRWLQAPYCVLVLLIVIATDQLVRMTIMKRILLVAFISLSLFVNFLYLQGTKNIYFKFSERMACRFKNAIRSNTIKKSTTNLYVWTRHQGDGIFGEIQGGSIFEYYQGRSKNIAFVDSIYHVKSSGIITSFPNFNKATDQIVFVDDSVIRDITDNYLKDSLKTLVISHDY